MFAALVLDHRLAFLFLAALNLGTAVPLAFGWARVLPEEPPPFATAEDSLRRRRNEPPLKKLMSERRDPFAIVLLLCVTVSYACQLPGVPLIAAGFLVLLLWLRAGSWVEGTSRPQQNQESIQGTRSRQTQSSHFCYVESSWGSNRTPCCAELR